MIAVSIFVGVIVGVISAFITARIISVYYLNILGKYTDETIEQIMDLIKWAKTIDQPK